MALARLLAAFLLIAALHAMPRDARATQGYDNCTKFIDSLPAAISTQGVYCLRHDLSTNMASGNAIEIVANNVTIDCNDFKIGGLAAGSSSLAVGIHADGRQNATVRNCNIRGFGTGIWFNYGAGHLIEDNRLDNNLSVGINVVGDDSLVRRNRVFDTGGFANGTSAFGIFSDADIRDNIVDGVFTTGAASVVAGIYSKGTGTQVAGNLIRGSARGITVDGASQSVADNGISSAAAAAYGIYGYGSTVTSCSGNTVGGFAYPIIYCKTDGGDNASL
jgi:hypothetical protein